VIANDAMMVATFSGLSSVYYWYLDYSSSVLVNDVMVAADSMKGSKSPNQKDSEPVAEEEAVK
jgi:hypothetical protein